MSVPQTDGMHRLLARFTHLDRRAIADKRTDELIKRGATAQTSHREPGDKQQLLGIPLILLPSPAWRPQPWDKPQTRR